MPGPRLLVSAAAAAAVAAWTSWAAALTAWGRDASPAPYADAVVVAGCSVAPDGGPSPCLDRRTRRGVALWRAGVAPTLVLTGGPTAGLPAEAQVAAGLARSLGVPPGALRVEDRSTSTWENALGAAALAHGGVIVVTDDFHALRARAVFACHFDTVSVAPVQPPPPEGVPGSLREVAALAWYALRGRLTCTPGAAPG